MANIAAIDIGSNAIRLIIANVQNQDSYEPVINQREAIRLGKDVFATGVISAMTLEKCQSAFTNFKKTIETHNVQSYRAIATSALRDAKNQKDFVKHINATCGISVKVISGTEEARLVSLAISKKVDLKESIALLVDIGGGSVELTITSDGNIISTESLNMGTVRFLQLLENKKKGLNIFDRIVKSYSKHFRRRLKKHLGKKKINFMVATGGTVENLGSVGKQFYEEKNENALNAKTLTRILNDMQGMSVEDRMGKYNLKADRADVIIPALILLTQIAKQAQIEDVLIPCVGLKEGILFDIISNGVTVKSLHSKRAELVSFAIELGKKFDFDEAHSDSVSKIALQIFDRTQKLHDLPKDYRVLLELAALLHDVGSHINIDSHHKHSQYIIRSCNFIGLNESQKNIVSCIARYHRKSVPKMEHVEFAALAPSDRKAVKAMASILRIAEVLSSEDDINTSDIKFYSKPGKIFLKISPRPDLILQKVNLKAQVKPFEEIFKVNLLIR